MEFLETVLRSFISLAILLFEYIGVCVITFAGIQGIINYVRRKPDTRLILAKGLAMGLEFKLGSEILRTVVVRSLEEIYIVAAIIALRAVLTILIHWEIKNEEQEERAKNPGTHTSGVQAFRETAVSAAARAVSEAGITVGAQAGEKAAELSGADTGTFAESTTPEAGVVGSAAESANPEAGTQGSAAKSAAPEAGVEKSAAESANPEAGTQGSAAESAAPKAGVEGSAAESVTPEAGVEGSAAENANPEAGAEEMSQGE